MLDEVREAIRRHGMLAPGMRVLVALSGGADSTALLHALLRLREELGIELVVAHLDHGIRPESGDDLAFVRAEAERMGLPFVGERADVPGLAREKRLNLEQAARLARRGFLERAAREAGAERIALGHTRTDVAETVLLHLVRGAGPRGLRGILPCTPPYVRPLIHVSREEARAFCRSEGIPFRDDPTNEDRKLLRNAVRLEVLPVLARFNPRVEDALARAGRLLAEAEEALLWTADLGLAEVSRPNDLDLELLGTLPRSVQALVVRRAAEEAGVVLESVHVERVLDAVREGRGEVHLPGGTAARVGTGVLAFNPIAGSTAPARVWELTWAPGGGVRSLPLSLSPGLGGEESKRGEWVIPELGWAFRVSKIPRPEPLAPPRPLAAYFDPRRIAPPLVVRTPRPGDRVRPLGMEGTKRVRDLLMEARVPRWERARWPLLLDGRGIVWVVGVALSDDHRVMPDATEVLTVEARRL